MKELVRPLRTVSGMIAAVVLATLLIAGSCGQWEAVPPGEIDYAEDAGSEEEQPGDDSLWFVSEVEGLYVMGFEASYLYPCRSNEAWWVYGSEELARKYYAVATDMHEHVYVRLSGYKSEIGEYGHMGGADRGFKVERILEIRKASDEDCGL